ncbi:MAG TPA: hypothetical protein VE978_07685 [Chitinophagales bacterium]|nr:hypothetical protein [Chitinophagales bacterium]
MDEITIWLDTYNDLYSDFDSRKFSRRLVSEDFLYELRRNAREVTSIHARVILYLPEKQRNSQIETEIIESLKRFFSKHAKQKREENKKLFTRGLLMSSVGLIFLLIAALLFLNYSSEYYFAATQVILEPAGWFLIWNGLDHIFYERKEIKSELRFYEKMKGSHIEFQTTPEGFK